MNPTKEIPREEFLDPFIAALDWGMLIIDAMRELPHNLKLLRERQAESKAAMEKLRQQVSRARK